MRRSYVIIVLVGLLLVATGFTLLHSHKDWSDRGCQLCNVRHLPGLYTAIVLTGGIPTESQPNCDRERLAKELKAYVARNSSRSPPTSASFSL